MVPKKKRTSVTSQKNWQLLRLCSIVCPLPQQSFLTIAHIVYAQLGHKFLLNLHHPLEFLQVLPFIHTRDRIGDPGFQHHTDPFGLRPASDPWEFGSFCCGHLCQKDTSRVFEFPTLILQLLWVPRRWIVVEFWRELKEGGVERDPIIRGRVFADGRLRPCIPQLFLSAL